MGQTAPDHADVHRRQSMILVPKNAPGVRIEAQMPGDDEAPVLLHGDSRRASR